MKNMAWKVTPHTADENIVHIVNDEWLRGGFSLVRDNEGWLWLQNREDRSNCMLPSTGWEKHWQFLQNGERQEVPMSIRRQPMTCVVTRQDGGLIFGSSAAPEGDPSQDFYLHPDAEQIVTDNLILLGLELPIPVIPSARRQETLTETLFGRR